MAKKDKVEKEIVALKEQVSVLDNQFKRVLADYQNLQKNQQRSNHIDRGRQISMFLPLLDDLERISLHFDDPSINMVIKQFNQVLLDQGVEVINTPKDSDFDPMVSECVEMVPGEPNKVQKTVEKGYRYIDIILRPANCDIEKGVSFSLITGEILTM